MGTLGAAVAAPRPLQKGFESLDGDFLGALPADLQVDLRDAGFALSNGPVEREVGGEAASALKRLGGALESATTAAAAAAAAELAASAAALPEGSSQRAALGRRLTAAGQKFSLMGSYGAGEVAALAKAFQAAGREVAAGCTEPPPPPAPSSPRVLKFGDLQLDLTRGSALGGAAASAVISALVWQLKAGVGGGGGDPGQLTGALDVLGSGLSFLALVTAVGLVVLGLQLDSGEQ
eukprot:SM000014S00229  [mRNA]  locus=s14:36094:37574:- [translate_table: standard]